MNRVVEVFDNKPVLGVLLTLSPSLVYGAMVIWANSGSIKPEGSVVLDLLIAYFYVGPLIWLIRSLLAWKRKKLALDNWLLVLSIVQLVLLIPFLFPGGGMAYHAE